jgi:hypothetical protein
MNLNVRREDLSFTKLGIYAVVGYLLFKNRFQIQKYLESVGVRTPWMTGTLDEAVQSGGAKIAGSLKREFGTGANEARM